MAIKYNGQDLLKRYFNGQEVQKVMYNGQQIRPDVVPPTVDYLCFTGTSGSSIALSKVGTPNAVYLEVSYDGTTWSDYTFGVQINYDSNINKVYFRNKSTTPTSFSYGATVLNQNYYKFFMNGSIAGSGDITTLLCKTGTTTLTSNGCFSDLFYDCTALTTAPRLPATTLTTECYYYMFHNTGITVAPDLPATTLKSQCYYGMFSNCASLTTVHTLPALTLPTQCYLNMFGYCTSLTTPPEILATTIGEQACGNMLSHCPLLNALPVIYATDIGYKGCEYMFYDCPNIKLSTTQTGDYQIPYRIPVSGTGTAGGLAFEQTLTGTGGAFTGTLSINTEYYLSTDNEIVGDFDYLCFTANTGGSTIQFNGDSSHNINMPQLQYSYDKEAWTDYYCDSYGGSEIVTLINVGDKVYFRNKSKTVVSYNTYYYANTFTLTGSISASGDVGFMLCRYSTNVMPDYCFRYLFRGGALTTAPRLPATTLGSYCYQGMLGGNPITVAPELPATTLAFRCCDHMFDGCTSLTTPPELPVTTLSNACYRYMFAYCSSLTTLPELPATTLTIECYYRMFYGCSNIKLSTSQGGDYQNEYMIPFNGGGTIGSDSMYEMFSYTGGEFKGTPTINQQYWTSNTVI